MNHQILNKADSQGEVIPFYFGESPKRLYGCHHLPHSSSGKSFAIVLCSAIGQEYLQSHRVIYQLAVLLSRAGFHVLRFDYFGCGDSEGEFEQGSVIQWTKDIIAAVEEVQNRSGRTRVLLIGLRMGATLALQAAANCNYIDGIILWEPVLSGERYLQELAERQRDFQYAWRHKIKPAKGLKEGTYEEFLGFPITSDMRRELEKINLVCIELPPSVRLLTVLNSEESACVSNLNHVTGSHPNAELQLIVDQLKVWKELYRRITPYRTLQYMVKWIDSL